MAASFKYGDLVTKKGTGLTVRILCRFKMWYTITANGEREGYVAQQPGSGILVVGACSEFEGVSSVEQEHSP